jgi:phosphate/sulfate permease
MSKNLTTIINWNNYSNIYAKLFISTKPQKFMRIFFIFNLGKEVFSPPARKETMRFQAKNNKTKTNTYIQKIYRLPQ